jgi:MFS transporter, PPP family, 3-phenylpropionic acid transporter
MQISEANRLRLLYFLVFCCTAAWLPILADFLKDRGLNGLRIGTVLSVTPLMMFLVQPFYGMLADRWGYKRCLLLSSFLAAISYVFFLIDGGFVYLLIVTAVMAVFYNTIQPILDSLSLQLAQADPKFSYGSLRIAGAAGWAFMGITAGYWIDQVSTSVIFIFSAGSMLLAFGLAWFVSNERSKEPQSEELQNYQYWREIFQNRTLLLLLLAVFLVSAGGTTIWNFYSIYLKENGASAKLVGYGLSFQGLCELPFFYFSAKIIQRLGIKNTLLLTIFATSLRMFLYSVVKTPEFAIAIEVLHGISWSLFWVVCVEYVNALVRPDWRASGQSLLYAAYYGIGAIVGNFWTGYLYDAKLKIGEIFFLNAVLVALVGLVLGWYLWRRKEL